MEQSKKYQELLDKMSGLSRSVQDVISVRGLPWFFYNSTNLFLVLNLDGEIVQMNKAWLDLLGFTPEELDHFQFLDLIHPEDLSRTSVAWSLATHIDAPKASPFYNRYRRKDGGYVWIKWPSNSATEDTHSGYVKAVAEPVLDARMIYGLELNFGTTENLYIP